MNVIRDASPGEFLQHAGALLYEREAEYGLPLGLVEALQTYLKPEITPLLLRVVENGITTAVCVQTRRENVMLSHLNHEQAAALAAYCREQEIQVAGASGPPPAPEAFCAVYSAAPTQIRMSNRILQLTRVIRPRPANGAMRVAGMNDFETAKRFFREFHLECIPDELPPEDQLATLIEDRIARQTIYLWENKGTPVSSAHTTRPTRGGMSIGPVYTPPGERGKGYASNLMAALSQRVLDGGKRFCVLFTDTHNPTSNRVYESIGYRVIATSEYLSYE
jgi:predicted GNAT family acetyltransferase